MKALVTGVSGFIGGALAAGLAQAGWEVNGLVRRQSRGKLPPNPPYQVFEADLDREDAPLGEAVHGCQIVFHAAAIRNRWGTSPEAYFQTNVEGTRRLLFASIGQIARFVYISSVGVFGRPGVLDIDETFPLASFADKLDYHTTKAEAERVVAGFQSEFSTVVARPTITYGPGDQDGMVTRLIRMIASGNFLRVGRGYNHLHLTYIDDLVHGLFLLGTRPEADGETFILAGSHSIAFSDLIELVVEALGMEYPWRLRMHIPEGVARRVAFGLEAGSAAATFLHPEQRAVPPLTRDQIDTLTAHRGFSYKKAERLAGYRPKVGYREGIRKTVEWMRDTGRLPERLAAPISRPAHSSKVT